MSAINSLSCLPSSGHGKWPRGGKWAKECSTILYYTILHSTLLYSTILYYTILYHTLLYTTML